MRIDDDESLPMYSGVFVGTAVKQRGVQCGTHRHMDLHLQCLFLTALVLHDEVADKLEYGTDYTSLLRHLLRHASDGISLPSVLLASLIEF